MGAMSFIIKYCRKNTDGKKKKSSSVLRGNAFIYTLTGVEEANEKIQMINSF